jgi:hypothetical protein
VLPTTGPFKKTIVQPEIGVSTRWTEMISYRQKKPYDLQLPYSSFTNRTISGFRDATSNYDSFRNSWWLQAASGDPYESTWSQAVADARNAAVKRFNAKRGEMAQIGVALAEVRQTMDMVTKRVIQLASAANSLRKGRFYDVAKTLGLVRNSKPPTKLRTRKRLLRWTKFPQTGKWYPAPKKITSSSRRGSHSFSNLWLEYSFGWAPTVSDLQTAMKVLSAPLSYQDAFKARGTSSVSINRYDDHPSHPGYTVRCISKGKVSCEVGAVLSVQNPNQDLAHRLGLDNPWAVAYELVPFSFVLNWIINLEEFIGQFNTFFGSTLFRAYYTDWCESNSQYELRSTSTGMVTSSGSHTSSSMIRTVGSLPAVQLGLRPVYHKSWRRAITQSALLVKLFTSAR